MAVEVPKFRLEEFKGRNGKYLILIGKEHGYDFTYEYVDNGFTQKFERLPYYPGKMTNRMIRISTLINEIFFQIDNEYKHQLSLKTKSYKTLKEYLKPNSTYYYKFKGMKYFDYIHDQIFRPYVESRLEAIKENKVVLARERQEEKTKDYTPEKSKEHLEQKIEDYEHNKELNRIYRQGGKERELMDEEYNPDLFKDYLEQRKKPSKETKPTNFIFQYPNTFNPPYRSKFKLDSLYKDSNVIQIPKLNSFSIKESKKKYHLKACSMVRHTFIGDLFFQGRYFAYLLLINVNTRKAYFYTLHDKEPTKTEIDVDEETTTETYDLLTKEALKDVNKMIKAFDEILKQTPIEILEFDGERAIGSARFKNYMKNKGIKYVPLEPKSHTSTALMDRLCRTIRDIAANMGYSFINNSGMKKIIDIYNNAPHKTLTKMLTQQRIIAPYGITPNDVDNSVELETLFVKECLKYNALIKSQDDYVLNVGDKVRVYNKNIDDKVFPSGINKTNQRSILSREIFTVKGYKGNLIIIQDSKGKEYIKPRRDLAKL